MAACNVPEFEFPVPAVQGDAGDASVSPTDPCQNKQLDADSGETDFDCGGACAPCDAGQHCLDAADCAEQLLCHEGVCIGLGCMNEAQDGAETDVDCGGGSCKECITGQGCAEASDCEAGVCGDAKCLAPACDDQVHNGKETAVDCGGDCNPCVVDQPCVLGRDCLSGECNDRLCGAECTDGFANCDKQNDNACEISIRTDLENCGFCGNVCNLPHAQAECSAGECRIETDGCAPGFQDCNGDPADGCEVDLKTNKLNCGTCNQICPALNGDPSCVAGVCEITCNDGWDDCDESSDNGCEVNLDASRLNCSACDQKCPADLGYSAYCKDGTCGQTACAAGKDDCNGDPADGCETNTATDVDNCGDCGTPCSANNAEVACVGGKCVITGCVGSYADCNKPTADGYKDGCEVDVDVNTSNCGGCGKACTITNGTPKCDAGSCEVNSCSGTFRDCDGDPKTGCEVNVATNTKNCGGCGAQGSDCSTRYANATATCSSSACTTPACNSGYGDCSGGIADGCETNTTVDGKNCGGCGNVCENVGVHVTTNNCVNSQCDPKCAGTYLTCDGNKKNGCEADSTTDEANCGACGTSCSMAAAAHVVTNQCLSSTCDPQCDGTWDDCDSNPTNGCEVDTAVSNSNCGGCDIVCSTVVAAHVLTNNCVASSCDPKCNGLYDDCDDSRVNGCEKDVSADASNCGGCDIVCGATNAAASPGCVSGTCNPSCNAGWAKCTTPEKGCVTPLGTTSNCTKCGETCSGNTPFCDPAVGCVDHRDIVVVNKGTQGVAGWDGSANVVAEIKLSHGLQTAKSNNRMLVVGVACTDNYTNPDSVTVSYAGTPMLLAVEQEDGGKHSYAGIYYLLDSALPDAAGPNQVVASFGPAFTWGHVGVDVLELKNAHQVAPIATGGSAGDASCGAGASRTATVSFAQTGSLVYGVLGARGATKATLSSASGLVETWNQHQIPPDHMVGAAAYVPDNDNRTLTWNVEGCYNTATAIAAFKRLSLN